MKPKYLPVINGHICDYLIFDIPRAGGGIDRRELQLTDTEIVRERYDPSQGCRVAEILPVAWVDVSRPFQATLEFEQFAYNRSSVGYLFKDVNPKDILSYYITGSTMEKLIPLMTLGKISGTWKHVKTGPVRHIVPA